MQHPKEARQGLFLLKRLADLVRIILLLFLPVRTKCGQRAANGRKHLEGRKPLEGEAHFWLDV